MQAVLPLMLKRLEIDLCHFTNGVAPAWLPTPNIITIHDMTLWLYPQFHYYRRIAAMKPLIPIAARRASAVIAVSENTKRDIETILGIPPEKIHVIYEAAAPHFRPVTNRAELEEVRRQLNLPSRFVLYVGNVEPRKNLERLIRAIARINPRHSSPTALVIVGSLAWGHQSVLKTIEAEGVSDRVIFLGYVDEQHLAALYSLCEVFAYPSHYEGFGLPVLEAMACGAPVVTTNQGSLSEVAGEAAAFVTPDSVDHIADTLCDVLTIPSMRQSLIERGFEQTARFSWKKAARETLSLYSSVMETHKNKRATG
jgi:glycosyltransferase involved in cell wall biosynthesis